MKTRNCLLSAFLAFCFCNINAQTSGTYSKTDKTGAACTIAVIRAGKSISAEVFAWWHTSSERHGAFSGEGILQNNTVVLKDKEDPNSCSVTLHFKDNTMDALFEDCINYNLPEDFSGVFHLLTRKVPGDYVVIEPKVFFYKTPDTAHPMKAFLIKGNKVIVDLENIADKDWVFINYTNASKQVTSGYMQWSALR